MSDQSEKPGNPQPPIPKSEYLTAVLLFALIAVVFIASAAAYAVSNFSEPIPTPRVFRQVELSYAQAEYGRELFVLGCGACHISKEGTLAPRLSDSLPPLFGQVRVPNLSRDPLYGNSEWTDSELYRVLRYAVNRDGRRIPIPMPGYQQLHDSDIDAIVNFLRLDEDLAKPVVEPTRPSAYSTVGKLISVALRSSKNQTPNLIPREKRGRYLAEVVMHCSYCHSPGTGALNQSSLYSGSSFLYSAAGTPLNSPAINGPQSILRHYTQESFFSLLRYGQTFDGFVVEMPLAPTLSRTDSDLVFEYLMNQSADTGEFVPPEDLRTRAVQAQECGQCHQDNVAQSDPAFAEAHLISADAKSLYYALRAPSFQKSSGQSESDIEDPKQENQE